MNGDTFNQILVKSPTKKRKDIPGKQQGITINRSDNSTRSALPMKG